MRCARLFFKPRWAILYTHSGIQWTTAHSLCFAFGLLALHPDEREKIYEHIKYAVKVPQAPVSTIIYHLSLLWHLQCQQTEYRIFWEGIHLALAVKLLYESTVCYCLSVTENSDQGLVAQVFFCYIIESYCQVLSCFLGGGMIPEEIFMWRWSPLCQ
jgi:hypothetical protein